jgi:hypothetical protein
LLGDQDLQASDLERKWVSKSTAIRLLTRTDHLHQKTLMSTDFAAKALVAEGRATQSCVLDDAKLKAHSLCPQSQTYVCLRRDAMSRKSVSSEEKSRRNPLDVVYQHGNTPDIDLAIPF